MYEAVIARPWARVAPYAAGLFTGWLVYKLGGDLTLNKVAVFHYAHFFHSMDHHHQTLEIRCCLSTYSSNSTGLYNDEILWPPFGSIIRLWTLGCTKGRYFIKKIFLNPSLI